MNVYDIAGKLFLIKFSSSLVAATGPEEDDTGKSTLLIEAGVRFHLTTFERKKSAMPSGWTMNLRKLLKNKQLERIDQIGSDRVVVLQFGLAEKTIFVILELYAKGNIVVTDAAFRVSMLLRSFQFEDGSVIAKGEVFPMASAANTGDSVTPDWQSNDEIMNAIAAVNLDAVTKELIEASNSQVSKRKRKLAPETSKAERVIMRIVPFAHSSLVSAALKAGLTAGAEWVTVAVDYAIGQLESAKTSTSGFTQSLNDRLIDFAPVATLLDPLGDNATEYSTFSEAVDIFFSKLETSTEADKVESQRKALLLRVDNIKADQERRIAELESEQELVWAQADLLECNLEIAEAAIAIMNTLIGKQMSWPEIEEAVRAQARNGHPIACKIGKIDFPKNRISLRLADDGEGVWIDLGLNATGNVSHLHAVRKGQKEKLAKTRIQAGMAIKQAESRLRSDLTKFNDSVERDRHLAKVRRRFWFERFYWFVTSENFLVIAGRDAAQNEAIFKKYLRPRDVYVHADIHGAATVVIKNHLSDSVDIPPLSLAEAGQFSLCHSSAWQSKIVTSAWWVRAEQVSKTAPTGEYLTTGSFMIRGKKNFLPPIRLELGVGILYYISEESAKQRAPERTLRSVMDADAADSNALGEGLVSIVTTGEKIVPRKQISLQASTGKAKPVVAVVKPPKPEPVQEAVPTKGGHKPKSRSELRAQKKVIKKDKYFDYDEAEDEKIRAILMGTKRVEEAPKVEAVAAVTEATQEKACYVCGQVGHLASECTDRPSRAQKITTPEDDEDDGEVGPSEHVMDRLVGIVQETDELIHALPVCAPYQALVAYGSKVKIIPGSMKRGKAAKLCSTMFGQLAQSEASKRLAKLIPIEEFSECLVNEVKVTGAGVTKIQVDSKKLKKKQNKSASTGK